MPMTNDIERLHGRISELEARVAALEGVKDDGWITWNGGECPVPYTDNVRVRFSNGDIKDIEALPINLRWTHSGCEIDIIAYRVVK